MRGGEMGVCFDLEAPFLHCPGSEAVLNSRTPHWTEHYLLKSTTFKESNGLTIWHNLQDQSCNHILCTKSHHCWMWSLYVPRHSPRAWNQSYTCTYQSSLHALEAASILQPRWPSQCLLCATFSGRPPQCDPLSQRDPLSVTILLWPPWCDPIEMIGS